MNIMKDLHLVVTNEKAKTPMRSTTGSAGNDVFAPTPIYLKKGEVTNVELPFAFEGELDGDRKVRLFVRSSFGIKKKVRLVENNQKNIEGVQLDITNDRLTVSLLNDSEADLTIAEGEHFSQFIISEKNPKKEKQAIEALTPEELGDVVPTKGHMEVAEPNVYDYILDEEIVLQPNEQITIATGYRSVIEPGTWTAIVPHESVKDTVMLANQTGIIDYDYQFAKNFGHCFLGIVNLRDVVVTLPIGTKLTQWYTEKYYVLENEIKTDQERTGGVGHTSK